RGFVDDGILVNAASSKVTISDMVVSGDGSGVVFAPFGDGSLTVERVESSGNALGFVVTGTNAPSTARIVGAITDCVASGNIAAGIATSAGQSGARPQLTVVNCKIANNANGISVNAGTSWLTRSTITNSQASGFIVASGATLNSFGDNFIADTTHVGSL